MAFHPAITPSDKFAPNSVRENNIRDLLNRMDGMSASAVRRGSSHAVAALVYNSGVAMLAAGSSVEITTGYWSGDAVPVALAAAGAAVWGILRASLAPGDIGDAVFCGAEICAVSGTVADFVAPDGEGGLIYSSSGIGRALFASSGVALVLLGGAGGGDYAGPFKITYLNGLLSVPGGYVLANGAAMSVGAATVSPATGYLCLYAQLSEAGAWSYGYNIQTYPATDGSTAVYPLAYITVPTGGGTPAITQFHHSLPQLWVLGTC